MGWEWQRGSLCIDFLHFIGVVEHSEICQVGLFDIAVGVSLEHFAIIQAIQILSTVEVGPVHKHVPLYRPWTGQPLARILYIEAIYDGSRIEQEPESLQLLRV